MYLAHMSAMVHISAMSRYSTGRSSALCRFPPSAVPSCGALPMLYRAAARCLRSGGQDAGRGDALGTSREGKEGARLASQRPPVVSVLVVGHGSGHAQLVKKTYMLSTYILSCLCASCLCASACTRGLSLRRGFLINLMNIRRRVRRRFTENQYSTYQAAYGEM